MPTHLVDAQDAGTRLDRWLSRICADLSRSRIQQLIKTGHVQLNGSPTKAHHLLAEGDQARRRHCGDVVHVRGIIEFSNRCSRNCLYCGMRRDNADLPRYRMSESEIVETAAFGAEAGLGTIVLQSGECDEEDPESLARVIERIKVACDVAVTLSAGVKPVSALRLWREAGADRYLLKHETANPRLFARLRPGCSLDERLCTLAALRELGYQVGSGNMVGLPGQTLRDLAEDIALAERLDVDMASFGPFVPNPKTPLWSSPPGDMEKTLRVVAVARIALGAVHIPGTTSLDAIAPDGRKRALQCGANVLMVKLTPARYRAQYDIYPGAPVVDSLAAAREIIQELGRPEGEGYGHSMKVAPADGGNR